MDYSKLIRSLRERMLLTQTEFAEKLGVSFGSVNRWENGKHEPTMRVKRQLKKFFIKYRIEEEN
jgi:putative transcriptional regulator